MNEKSERSVENLDILSKLILTGLGVTTVATILNVFNSFSKVHLVIQTASVIFIGLSMIVLARRGYKLMLIMLLIAFLAAVTTLVYSLSSESYEPMIWRLLDR